MKTNIIQQGAEAIIILKEVERQGTLVPYVIKDRVSKKYRHPTLDEKIIKTRTKKEAKILEKASKLINAPKPTNLKEIEASKNHGALGHEIEMPFIKGDKLSEKLEELDYKKICIQIGNQIAKLHDADIIHGDLTTSNMIWVEHPSKEMLEADKTQEKAAKSLNQKLAIKQNSSKDLAINKNKNAEAEHEEASNKATSKYPKLYFIDFGLGFTSERFEDKAVDLHLIKQALEAKHFSIHKECEKIIIENYNSKDRTKTLEQLKKVESRGRYKH